MTERDRRRRVDLFIDVLVAAVLIVLIWLMAG